MNTSTSAHKHSYTLLLSGSIRIKVLFSRCNKCTQISLSDINTKANSDTKNTDTFSYLQMSVVVFSLPGLSDLSQSSHDFSSEWSIPQPLQTSAPLELLSAGHFASSVCVCSYNRHSLADTFAQTVWKVTLTAEFGWRLRSSWSNILLINNSAFDVWILQNTSHAKVGSPLLYTVLLYFIPAVSTCCFDLLFSFLCFFLKVSAELWSIRKYLQLSWISYKNLKKHHYSDDQQFAWTLYFW